MDKKELAFSVARVAEEAGRMICAERHPQVFVKEGHANFVTSMDIACQSFLLEKLSPLLPGAQVMAEEQDNPRLLPGYCWIIDPIDGTTNYMHDYRHSSISIALVKDGEGVLGVVHNPYLQESFVGVRGIGAFLNGKPIRVSDRGIADALVIFGSAPYHRGLLELTARVIRRLLLDCRDIRRTGSAALDLCYIACGRTDGFFEATLCPWDFAAAAIVLQEAGGQVRPLDGAPFRFDRSSGMVGGNPIAFPALWDGIQEEYQEWKREKKLIK